MQRSPSFQPYAALMLAPPSSSSSEVTNTYIMIEIDQARFKPLIIWLKPQICSNDFRQKMAYASIVVTPSILFPSSQWRVIDDKSTKKTQSKSPPIGKWQCSTTIGAMQPKGSRYPLLMRSYHSSTSLGGFPFNVSLCFWATSINSLLLLHFKATTCFIDTTYECYHQVHITTTKATTSLVLQKYIPTKRNFLYLIASPLPHPNIQSSSHSYDWETKSNNGLV